MLRLGLLAVSLLILVLVALPSTTSSQNQRARGQQNKFLKRANKIPNRYIVVLNDDVADNDSPREARLERVTEIANEHALAHLGRPDYIYETALKGYAIELPNEAAAEAISRRPEVQWVEEDQGLEKLQVPASPQPSPPWNLDAIDGDLPTPNVDLTGRTTGSYIFHGTGAGVDAYVIDSGINTRHVEFGPPPFSTRATQAADCIRNVDCRQGPASGFVEGPCIVSGMPNTINNDCDGHGTLVAGVIGGINFGVAKAVNIKSIKVCTLPTCPASALVQGINWLTSQHFTDSSVPKVANISLGYHDSFVHNPPTPNNSSIDLAVNNSINTGITYVIAAGNSDIDARTFHPAAVPAALTVGAIQSDARRWFASNWGPGIDLWAPGDFIRSALTGVGGGPFGTCIFWDGTDSDDCFDSGTSLAAPHVAGAVAIYLQNRTGLSNCGPFPIDGPAPQGAANLSTCPDRVGRYLKATAILDRLLGIDGFDSQSNRISSNNRFLWSVRVPTAPNPLVAHRFFIWNQYQDFLNREPDNGGMNFYANILDGCLGNQECIKHTRATLSGNFFRSPEFGERGAYIANLYNIVYGQRPKTPDELNDTSKVERPRFNEFIADLQAIAGTNVSALKTTLALNWLTTRDEVKAILPSTMTPAAFVARLELTAGLTLPNRTEYINALISGSQSRAQVLRAIAEHPDVVNKFVLQNFVTMQYIGHLRRAPEDCHNSPIPSQCGYIFHYNRFGPGLDQHTVQTLITRGFIESPEYQRRFGPPF